jgi:hypothetical protein
VQARPDGILRVRRPTPSPPRPPASLLQCAVIRACPLDVWRACPLNVWRACPLDVWRVPRDLSLPSPSICANRRNLRIGRGLWPGFCETNRIHHNLLPAASIRPATEAGSAGRLLQRPPVGTRANMRVRSGLFPATRGTNRIRHTLLSTKWIQRARRRALPPVRSLWFPSHPRQSAVGRAYPLDVWRACPLDVWRACPLDVWRAPRKLSLAPPSICANLRNLWIRRGLLPRFCRTNPIRQNTSFAQWIRPASEAYPAGRRLPDQPIGICSNMRICGYAVLCGRVSAKRTQSAYSTA